MIKRMIIVIGFLLALAAGLMLALTAFFVWKRIDGLPLGDRIGVAEVRGFISNPRPVVETLREFREDEQIKAVVLRVESPGGVIGPSQEIHDEVKRTATAKPLVVSMGAVAASGGYYISAPASEIVANPGTATGSIGVILQFQEMHVLFDKLGLRTRVVKSGPMKDAGSPFRELSEEEREVFQNLIDDLFDQFVQAVAEGREMDQEAVLALADGRVYSGRQALALGLIDRLGGFWDAVELAQDLAGLEGKPKLEYRRRHPRGMLRWILGEDAAALSSLEAVSAPPLRYALPSW